MSRTSEWMTTDLENIDEIQIHEQSGASQNQMKGLEKINDKNCLGMEISQNKTSTPMQNNEKSHQLITDPIDDASSSISGTYLEPGSTYEEVYFETGKNSIFQARFYINLCILCSKSHIF